LVYLATSPLGLTRDGVGMLRVTPH
jgi:hypothetical protein